MMPHEVAKMVLDGLTLDLHGVTVNGQPGVEGVLSWNEKPFCRARCEVPPVPTAAIPASCPHPHSSVDDVRSALLGVVTELRRAGKVCEASGQHYRADAFYDAATYIEEGKWPPTFGLPVKP